MAPTSSVISNWVFEIKETVGGQHSTRSVGVHRIHPAEVVEVLERVHDRPDFVFKIFGVGTYRGGLRLSPPLI
jgi:hypothetical protein